MSRAINDGIAGIPRDRVRLHVCYGNWEGPHIHDVPLATILPALYQAQGRRAVDRVLQSAPRARIRGVQEASAAEGHAADSGRDRDHHRISSSIRKWWRAASRKRSRAVGERERVIASTDCGFGTFTNREWVIEPAVWLKLKSLRQGADIASARLWGKKSAA